MGRKYIQTIAGLILALLFLTAIACSDQGRSTENSGEVLQTQEIEGAKIEEIEETETEETVAERINAEIESYIQKIEGEWVAVEYVGSTSDHLPQEYYTEEYWEETENYINTSIEEHLGKEYRIESDNLFSVGMISDGTVIIPDNNTLSSVIPFFHPEIPIEAPYVGLSIIFQDDIDDFYSVIIDNNGIVLIGTGACFFRLERKTETNDVESNNGKEEFFYFSGEEYFSIAEGEWIVGEYLCGRRDVYGGLSEERTDRIIEEYSGQKLCIERDNLGYFGQAFGQIFYPEDMERKLISTLSLEIQDLSPMEGSYICAKIYLKDRDEWYYFIFDSTGRGIVQIQNRFFWLERTEG